MKLENERQLENTRRKLSELQALITRNIDDPARTWVSDLSLESMRKTATKLQAEIDEYVKTHQTA